MTEIMLGDALLHWLIKKLGQLFRERKEKVNDNDFQPLSVTKNGIHIPKSKFANVKDANILFGNKSISAAQSSRPLAACLRALTEQMQTASPDELAALYDASALLLPASMGRPQNDQFIDQLRPGNLGDLLHLVDSNIDNAELSPRWVADHVGISARHIHRKFALGGMTFSSYVTTKQLERVRRELISDGRRKITISHIAFSVWF